MDEATHRLQQVPDQALCHMRAAVTVLARQNAIKAAKRQFIARGLKPHRMEHREIVERRTTISATIRS